MSEQDLWDNTLIWVLVFIACTICAMVCCCCFRSCTEKQDESNHTDAAASKSTTTSTRRCHLCLEEVGAAAWSSGSHRRACARENRHLLRAIPTLSDRVRCHNCGSELRLWPLMGAEEDFRCQERWPPCRYDCNGGTMHESDGFNRLVCFACDFDLCISCAENRMGLHGRSPATAGINLGPATAGINMEEQEDLPPSYDEAIRATVPLKKLQLVKLTRV